MAWITLTSGDLATAQNVNNNFNHIFGGHRLPRTSVGASFVATDGAYNVGTTTARWNNVYCNELNYDGSVTTDGKTLLANQAYTELSATASSVEITGLDGDGTDNFLIHGYFLTDHNTQTNIFMIINGDSAANYGSQIISSYESKTSAQPFAGRTTAAYFVVGRTTGFTTAAEKSFFRMLLYSKVGHERTGNITYGGSFAEGYLDSIRTQAVIWDNAVNTITSIKFYLSAGTFDTSTSITIWGQK